MDPDIVNTGKQFCLLYTETINIFDQMICWRKL